MSADSTGGRHGLVFSAKPDTLNSCEALKVFCLLPQGLQFIETELVQIQSPSPALGLYPRKASQESGVGLAQSRLGIHAQKRKKTTAMFFVS